MSTGSLVSKCPQNCVHDDPQLELPIPRGTDELRKFIERPLLGKKENHRSRLSTVMNPQRSAPGERGQMPERYMLHDCICVKFQNWQNYSYRNQISDFSGGEGIAGKGHTRPVGSDRHALCLKRVWATLSKGSCPNSCPNSSNIEDQSLLLFGNYISIVLDPKFLFYTGQDRLCCGNNP